MKRLSVNLRPKAQLALDELLAQGDLDITTSIQQGLELLAWWKRQEAAGYTHALRHANGEVTDLLMLG